MPALWKDSKLRWNSGGKIAFVPAAGTAADCICCGGDCECCVGAFAATATIAISGVTNLAGTSCQDGGDCANANRTISLPADLIDDTSDDCQFGGEFCDGTETDCVLCRATFGGNPPTNWLAFLSLSVGMNDDDLCEITVTITDVTNAGDTNYCDHIFKYVGEVDELIDCDDGVYVLDYDSNAGPVCPNVCDYTGASITLTFGAS